MQRIRLARRLGDDDSGTATTAEGETYAVADPTFSYADQFNAPSWLETPSMSLWFAMQARINGDLTGAVNNLNAFWTALNVVKATATTANWPEILALDSQSQIQSANITDAIINQVLQNANSVATFATLFGWKGADVKTTVANLQAQQTAALQSAKDLAAQANTAQAARVTALSAGLLTQAAVDQAQENTDIQNILAPPFSFLGIPAWAWGVGIVGLFLLLRGR